MMVVLLAQAAPHGALAGTIGGLPVTPVSPAPMVTVPALDETGCRVPMLVWRCRNDALTLVYAFDMDVAPETAGALRLWVEQEGRVLSDPAAWPLTASHRNATVPAAAAAELLRAAQDGAEVLLRLDDPATGSELRDRFALTDVAPALAALPCTP
ncbi:hypothetical protein CCR87_02300 [Rhodobaculum claviforme]|uniref:Uncharacterized protein n=2 Tax=Rhodobaculum claviforme TaxID=1549854 RepID=A0A934TJI6_9RHOB|nr:hypothetical protein [Rhodobaculum claviforme]